MGKSYRKIVVTGALGHIGSRLIRETPVFRNADIVLLDNLSTQRYGSLFNLPRRNRYRFIEADILTAPLEKFFSGAQAVVHLAALTDAEGSLKRKGAVDRVNVTGTERVARACLNTGAKLVFPSTTSVYGKQRGVVDEACKDLKPQSPYAASKLEAEKLLCRMGRAEGLRFVICRLGTIAGISPGMRFHTAVNKFCWQAVMGLPITVWRTALNQKRPYLDLGDAVRAMQFILRKDLFPGRVYNVVTANLTVRNILGMISARIPNLSIQYVDSEIMNQLSYKVSSRRMTRLGFSFRGSLGNAISDTLRTLRPANRTP